MAKATWSWVSCISGETLTWTGVSGDQQIVCAQSTPTRTSGYGSVFTGATCNEDTTPSTSSSSSSSSKGSTLVINNNSRANKQQHKI